MEGAAWRFEMQIFNVVLLPEVGQEPWAFTTLCFSHQDHRRHLRVQFGGSQCRGARDCRVAVVADPEVNGTDHRCVFQILDLTIEFSKKIAIDV